MNVPESVQIVAAYVATANPAQLTKLSNLLHCSWADGVPSVIGSVVWDDEWAIRLFAKVLYFCNDEDSVERADCYCLPPEWEADPALVQRVLSSL